MVTYIYSCTRYLKAMNDNCEVNVEGYIGIVEAVKNTQARIRVEDPTYKSGKRVVEAWNNISAKAGEKVLFEELNIDKKKMMGLTVGVPVLAAIAGFVFGGAMSTYFDQNIWLCRGVSTAFWLLAALIYIVPLRKNIAAKRACFVVTKVIYD